jgi:tartrate-resistant acid phosphatase type 5
MIHSGFRYAVFCLIMIPATLQLLAQSAVPPAANVPLSDVLLQKVPESYRAEAAKLHLAAPDAEQQKALKDAAALSYAPLALVVKQMSSDTQGFEFLLQKLEEESSAENRTVILKAGIQPQVRRAKYADLRPKVEAELAHLVAQDSNPDVAVAAAQVLRRLQWGAFSVPLAARAEQASKMGDTVGAARLLNEGNEWAGWDEQVNIPNFLRTAPPVFSVVPADKAIRVLAFGDFGTGTPEQIQTAAAMREYQKGHPLDFGITLGDNFYPSGAASPDDPQWKSRYEDLYGPMGIKFYATLGNHDYGRADSPAAEILYSQKSDSWRMPATYYTYTAGPVQFFAIDTIELSDTVMFNKEATWLDAEIAKSKSPWKVVYGHYQIYSATRGDEQNLIKRLLPILRNRVDVYLCGHDHNLQELNPEDGVHFFVSGAGGAGLYPFNYPNYAHSAFKDRAHGFTILEANDKQLTFRIIGVNGEDLHTSTINK